MRSYHYYLSIIFFLFITTSTIANHIEPPKDKLVMEPIPLNLNKVKQLIHYPEYARIHGIEAELPMQVLINKQGKIIAHRYTTAESKYFKQAINPHLKKIKFQSASYNGKPMRAWITIQFDFRLEDQ